MKKYLVGIISILCLTSCDPSVEQDTKWCEERYHTIILDSCEYLSCTRSWDLTHKGNCKFCAERRRQEELKKKNNNSLFDF